jgi:pimeloyl-ACP methyl ester carboxylesterase
MNLIKHFELDRNGKKIRGAIHLPEKTQNLPCVTFCHGFTASRIEPHFMYVKMSRALEKIGVASIRFDFLGSGESDGLFSEMTLSTEVADVEAVLNYACSLSFVDPNRISLLGFSMGGAVSLVSASRRPQLVDRLVLISPAANMLEVMTRDIRGQKIAMYQQGTIDVAGNMLSKAAIDDVFAINIYACAGKLKNKILFIHGTEDDQVPPFTSLKMHEMLAANSELKLIQGADHWYSSHPWEEELIGSIVDFFNDYKMA